MDHFYTREAKPSGGLTRISLSFMPELPNLDMTEAARLNVQYLRCMHFAYIITDKQ